MGGCELGEGECQRGAGPVWEPALLAKSYLLSEPCPHAVQRAVELLPAKLPHHSRSSFISSDTMQIATSSARSMPGAEAGSRGTGYWQGGGRVLLCRRSDRIPAGNFQLVALLTVTIVSALIPVLLAWLSCQKVVVRLLRERRGRRRVSTATTAGGK